MKRIILYTLSWSILAIGFFSIMHHLGAPRWFSTWGTGSVEMAVSTAVCFVLIGLIFLFWDRK